MAFSMLVIKNGSIIDLEIMCRTISLTLNQIRIIMPILDKHSKFYYDCQVFIVEAELTLSLFETAEEI